MTTCLYCGSTESAPWRRHCRDYFMGLQIRVHYVRCLSCGSVQQDPLPESPGLFYANYPIHQGRSPLYNRLRKFLFRHVYANPADLPPDAYALDYGCGDGWYLDSVRRATPHAFGFEYAPDHAEALARHLLLPVTADIARLSTMAPQGFDRITLHFVLEHVLDPVPLLTRLGSLLKPNGVIYVVIPEAASWEARMFGRYWHGLDPPRHLNFASEKGMQRAARTAHLRIGERRKLAFPNTSAGSLASLPGRFHSAVFTLLLPLGLVLSHLFPGGSVAYVLHKANDEARPRDR
jgi:SAM-dependent methyltransferase